MKKLATILTAAIMLFSVFAFASGTTGKYDVNARVKAAFLNDFSTASDISWEKIAAGYVARFTFNNSELNAAYNEEGELVGTSRQMESALLPISISLAIAKKYEGYTVSQKAMELTFEGDTNYYFAVENDRQYLKLKCSVGGSVTVEKKIKKK